MVVDDIENDGDAAGMGGVDQSAEPVRPAIALLDCEDEGRIVAPGDIPREFIGSHHLNCVDTEILEVVELADDGIEVAAPIGAGRIEHKTSDMQLVDDELIPGRRRIAGALPDIIGIGHDAVADRIGHRARVGIVFPEQRRRVGVGDDEFVFVADLRARHIGGPVPIAFLRQRSALRAPAVERPGNADSGGKGRPHTKRHSRSIGDRAHSGPAR